MYTKISLLLTFYVLLKYSEHIKIENFDFLYKYENLFFFH